MATTSRSNPLVTLALLFIAGWAVWAVGLPLLQHLVLALPAPEVPASYWKEMPEIEWVDHPELTHPVSAAQARNCLEHYGPTAYFIESEKSGRGIHFLCQYPGEKDVYTLVFDFCKKTERFIQRTAFDKARSISSARTALIKKGGRYIDSPRLEHLYQWLVEYGLR